MVLSLGIMVIVGVVVFGALFYVLVRFRDKPGDLRKPATFAGNHKLEILWTVLPAVLLIILAVPTVSQSFYDGELVKADSINVTVVGHQFWWQFNYPGRGLVTANELHIPTGVRVNMTLESVDVIHSFWVPRLGGKTDVIPGRHNVLWIEANSPGVYPGQCALYCGFGHADMKFLVIAQTPQAFAQWERQMKQPFSEPTSALAKQGMNLFETVGCATCHTIAGTSYQGTIGPNLTALGLRQGIAAETLVNNDANLATWLHDPQAVKPGALMPDLHLTDAQVHALVAFLHGLK